MHMPTDPGQIVVLNGVSRAGKSTIARLMQETVLGVWIHFGMDAHKACTPGSRQPGVGLRPGRHQVSAEVEDCVPILYAALYESVAAHARLGLNVVMDVNHHDSYSAPRGILQDCARRLSGFPVLFVGVRCPIDVIWSRRETTWGQKRGVVDAGVAAAVELAQLATHAHGTYDLEVDTSMLSSGECAQVIGRRLADGPPGSAFSIIAARGGVSLG
jgi:chloramphenicol 3-O phosphotransferase